MDKGATYELTHYDKKNKMESITKSHVKDVIQKNGQTVAVVNTIMTDKHGD